MKLNNTYLEQLLLNRKVVRNYKKINNFDTSKLDNIAKYSIKIPTAGFSRGVEILQVNSIETIKKIASIFNEDIYLKKNYLPWISNSVSLFFIFVDEDSYHSRYSLSDKNKSVNSNDWDIPYWYVDSGSAIMNCMLLIEEQELKSGFMGLHSIQRSEVHKLLKIPNKYTIIGFVTAGVENENNALSRKHLKKKKLTHYEKYSK